MPFKNEAQRFRDKKGRTPAWERRAKMPRNSMEIYQIKSLNDAPDDVLWLLALKKYSTSNERP